MRGLDGVRLLGLGLLASCSAIFTEAPLPEGDDPDAEPPTVDANVPGFDCEAWQTSYFDPCALPLEDLPPLTLDLPGQYLYDTGTGVLLDPSGNEVEIRTAQTALEGNQQGHVIVAGASFELALEATLRAQGKAPLVVASTGSIKIDGTIDVSSVRTGDLLVAGAGADVDCPSASTLDGIENPTGGTGGSGGAGGSNLSMGGSGGASNKSGDIVAGGMPLLRKSRAQLVGGCPGGKGIGRVEEESNPADLGLPGSGGGAVLLAAFDDALIVGDISAGGAGGAAGLVWAGGGGGGSGGTIIVEASDIRIDVRARLKANGGGGGGASTHPEDMVRGEPGQNALLSDEMGAAGGISMAQHSAGGGAGGYGGPGQAGFEGEDSGGGGGGSTGRILIQGDSTEIDGGAVLVPTPSTESALRDP